MSRILNSDQKITLGVVSDSHIPDRVTRFHPDLLTRLREERVDHILHAGDISTKKVLRELESLAPVTAVLGNRDFLLRKEIPVSCSLLIQKVHVVLTHGHMTAGEYWRDKIANLFKGYYFARYKTRLRKLDPNARIYVFGHSHYSENRWEDGQLFFNPGSCSVGTFKNPGLSFGIITIMPDGTIESRIHALM